MSAGRAAMCSPDLLLFRILLLLSVWITSSLATTETTAISQECLPCNSTISFPLTLADFPRIGFLCNEGFPSRPLEAPYTCLYTLKHEHRQNYTLQLFLHELHFRHNTLEISVCPQYFVTLMKMSNRPNLKRERMCTVSHPRDFVFTANVAWGSTLNITIINRSRDFHLRLPTDHYGNRYGYNMTYEIKPFGLDRTPLDLDEGNLVHHAYHSHLSQCNFNGIPVLKPSSDVNGTMHYKFQCKCLAQGTWGESCQYDDNCTLDTETSLCHNQGKCRIIASMLNCNCFPESGYFGTYCEYPHTAQPNIQCSECDDSNSFCHILTIHNRNETRCSCRAGYQLADDNMCQLIHKYDIVVDIPEQVNKAEKDYERMVKQIIQRSNNKAENFTTASQPKRGIVQVQFSTDQSNFSLGMDGFTTVNFSSTPHLSLGPVEAYLDGESQKFKCEVYGGDDMVFTWLKNDIKIYSTNVHKCKASENIKTLRLEMEATAGPVRNLAKKTCRMHLKIDSWTERDQGKYTCRVSDRHHIQESHLIMNCSSELNIVMTPMLATVRYGSDLTINCRTSKYWESSEQYNTEWTLFPNNHSSGHIPETILYHSSNLIIKNITGDIEVKCTVFETEIVNNWCHGSGIKKDSGKSSIIIRVLKPEDISKNLYCSKESAYGIKWQETPVSKYDLQLCPIGFSGVSSRACDDESQWQVPDFSNCTFDQLSKVFHILNLQHSLGLHGPEASLVDINAQNLTKEILETMEARKDPLLPGESTHILQLLRKIIDASRNKSTRITSEVFFGVINLVVGQEKKFNTRKVENITKLIQDFLNTVTSPEKKVTLSSVSAYAKHLYLHDKFTVNITSQSSSWWVATQVNSAQLKTTHQATAQMEISNERLLAQVVTFMEPQLLFSHGSLSCDGSSVIAANLSAPLVHVTLKTDDSGSTPHIQEKIQDADDLMLTLKYPCNNFMDMLQDNMSQHSWKWQCGRANFSYQTARWDLSVCTIQHRDGGSCFCSCYGQGLYGLLQVSFDPPPTPIHEMKEMLGVCLSISCCILVLCGALLLPRCHKQAVQLRLLKCLTLATFNSAFVLYAFYPIPKPDYVWVLILCIWCQIFALGIGVAQMMAIFINLSNMSHQSGSSSDVNIAPMTDMLQNLPVSPTTIILIIALFMASMCSGIIYLVCLVTGYELTRPFLPVKDAPGLTGTVLGFMITISVLWGYLCISNLMLMRMKSSSQQQSSAHVVRRLVSLMLADWVFIIMSLFEDFNAALNSLFSITALALSIMAIWIYIITADDMACCFGNHNKESDKGKVSGVNGRVESGGSTSGGDDGSCMSGLMACHISTNRSSYVGTESTSGDYRTRGDSMLSQISSSAANFEYHEANPSYGGGPRTKFLVTHRNPKDILPQHPNPINLQMYSLSEEQSTNNIILRGGIDFVCGGNDSDISNMNQKRSISFTHQPTIHEKSSGKNYLDMKGDDDKEKTQYIEPPVTFSNCARRSYVNIPTNNSCKKGGKLQKNVNEKGFLEPQNNSKKGYLQMMVKDKNDLKDDHKGLNGKTTNVKCNAISVEINKNSESDEESPRAEFINESIPTSQIEFEEKTIKRPYVNNLTPRKENGIVKNENEQIIIMQKNNVQSQEYVNSPKHFTKIYINTNENDHTCSSVITTKDYINRKSSFEMTPPFSLSPIETPDSITGDASSEATSVHSSPRITR